MIFERYYFCCLTSLGTACRALSTARLICMTKVSGPVEGEDEREEEERGRGKERKQGKNVEVDPHLLAQAHP